MWGADVWEGPAANHKIETGNWVLEQQRGSGVVPCLFLALVLNLVMLGSLPSLQVTWL